jgi:hypothetical protein
MKRKFTEMMAEVERRYDALRTSPPFKCGEAPVSLAGKAGIYLFSEKGKPLYVGRTDDLRKRLANHRHRSHNTATFAFLLARHATDKKEASYQSSGSRDLRGHVAICNKWRSSRATTRANLRSV